MTQNESVLTNDEIKEMFGGTIPPEAGPLLYGNESMGMTTMQLREALEKLAKDLKQEKS